MIARLKIPGLSFWLTVSGCLLAVVLVFLRLFFNAAAPPTDNAPSRLRWLLTLDGERRGFVIASDLRRDGAAWELWGPGPHLAPLNTIADLRPGTLFTPPGFGINGGFWDESRQAVGICAGERGIHAALSHPGGFALSADRAWIGPLTARVRLISPGNARLTSRTLDLSLNPQPLPRRAPYLLDPAALAPPTRPLKLENASQVYLLDKNVDNPLHFNTTVTLTLRKVSRQSAGDVIPTPPDGTVVLVRPARDKAPPDPLPRPGTPYRLSLALDPVKGVVRLATCAGPRLIREGKISDALAQGENSRAERTWRTAVGCDAEGHRLWVVVLARGRDGLPGVTLRETAQTLGDLGATEALNLDGGSSTSVWQSRLASELRSIFPLQNEIHHAIFYRKELSIASPQP